MRASGESDDEQMLSEDGSIASTNDTEPASPDAAAAAILAVKNYLSSPETCLAGLTGPAAVDALSNVEFEIARILDDVAGEEGRRFKETAEYVAQMDKLKALKRQHDSNSQPMPPAPMFSQPLGSSIPGHESKSKGQMSSMLLQQLDQNDMIIDKGMKKR